MDKDRVCRACNGTGKRAATTPIAPPAGVCPVCGGTGKWLLTPEPVAPTPSPDIAGLVDKYVHMSAATANERLVYDDGFLSPKMLEPFMEDVRALATALQRVAQERDAANREATRLLVSFVHEHCDPVPDWAPLPDLMGVLTQISNAVTVTRDIQGKADRASGRAKVRIMYLEDQLTAAEARLSSARDEGREEVAEWLHQNGHITLAAAIRALKAPTEGTKP